MIACYDQSRELELTLRSFVMQEIPYPVYELIVVDDHSPDFSARTVVARFSRLYPDLRLIYVRQYRSNGGSYGSSAIVKNVGLRLAQGEYVFFNNSEIVQVGETLNYILAQMHQAKPKALCLRGVVIESPYEEIDGAMAGGLEAIHDNADRGRERVATADHAGLAAVSRQLLLTVGGNDERFDYWGKEDLDLAARLKRVGVQYIYDPQLKSLHVSHPPNFVREADYLRMCSLLDENNRASLVEANIGRLWGQLHRPPSESREMTIVLNADDDLLSLSRCLCDVLYEEGSERHDVLVVCPESLRCKTEAHVYSRFRTLQVISLPELSLECFLRRVIPQVRTTTVAYFPVSEMPATEDKRIAINELPKLNELARDIQGERRHLLSRGWQVCIDHTVGLVAPLS